LGVKHDVRERLERLPLFGDKAVDIVDAAKDAVKHLLVNGVMFEKLGFKYFGPVDGHDIESLKSVMERVKDIDGPVMLHVITVKGKGYDYSEEQPVSYHGVGSFCVDTGAPVESKKRSSYTDVFGRELCKLAQDDKKIVAITAAMPDGTGLSRFRNLDPGRFHDVGIAEGHAVTFAAGLARGGMKPVVAVYSTFLQRAYDQILHDVCLQNLPVVFAIDRAGVVGADGETHQGLYDLSFLSHIPNMMVMAPKNKYEFQEMLAFAFKLGSPVALRYPRAEISVCLKEHNAVIELGRSEEIRRGAEVALVSVGAMMDTTLEAEAIIKKQGISIGVYNARFVKPMDMELVSKLKRYPFVFVLEDNARAGGFGSRLVEAMAVSRSLKSPDTAMPYFYIFALPDAFIEQGSREEIFKRYKMDAASVAAHILTAVKAYK
jgi:1-deoxy-D-xylulose-5-phosphate synthase